MTVTLKIEKNVYGGEGLGRLGDGRVCFVNGAFAGETVKAELVQQKKRFVRARLVELLEPSSEREILPGAEDSANVMPGMVYAPISYAQELKLKQDQLENFMLKVSRVALPLEVIASPKPLHYRNKVVYHTEKWCGEWRIGYRVEPENNVVDVVQDPLACEAINAELPAIRAGVKALLTQGSRAVRKSAKEADNITIRWTAIDGVKWWMGDQVSKGLELHEQTDGKKFRVPVDGFYQVNPWVGDLLVRNVREEYEAIADKTPAILDLYCGVGVFGLCCAPQRLVGVESVQSAITCAKRNAEAFGQAANFFCERVGGSLQRIKVGRNHTVIVDPPRGGMEPNVPHWLAWRAAKRIFYVSCDPATLVRDLEYLVKGYTIQRVKLFDMFPRTARFETLVVLDRKD